MKKGNTCWRVPGLRVVPGKWRPQYLFEQIAWIRPPWPGRSHLRLDFPEAIFSDQGCLYLSHRNPRHPVLFPDLPKIEWQVDGDGLAFWREMPNGVGFGGRVGPDGKSGVALALSIANGSRQFLIGLRVQTCLYLRAVREFSQQTNDNKFVRVPGRGWISLTEALALHSGTGSYRIGWRQGPAVVDRPVVICRAAHSPRTISMTWFADTFSLTGNPQHPCMHADPGFPDLAPGAEFTVRGRIDFSRAPGLNGDAHG